MGIVEDVEGGKGEDRGGGWNKDTVVNLGKRSSSPPPIS